MYQEKSLPLPIPRSFNVAKVVEVGTWSKNACLFQHCIRGNGHFWNSLNLGVILKYFLHHCLERVWKFLLNGKSNFSQLCFYFECYWNKHIFWFVSETAHFTDWFSLFLLWLLLLLILPKIWLNNQQKLYA